LLEVNASFLVIFVQLWNEELKVVKLFLKHPVFYIPLVTDLFRLDVLDTFKCIHYISSTKNKL